MPRILFYAGIICSAVAALFATAESWSQLNGQLFHFGLAANEGLSYPDGLAFALAALLFAVPITSLFIRMGSLIATRNLFESFFSLFASISATVALIFLAFVQLRKVMLGAAEAAAFQLAILTEVNLVAFYAFALLLSLALVSLRPYFLIQSSSFLAVMVCIPLPLFGVVVVQQLFGLQPSPAAFVQTWFGFSFFAALAILFFSIPVHSFRHRHLFLERTNLRALLDSRVDPAVMGASQFPMRTAEN